MPKLPLAILAGLLVCGQATAQGRPRPRPRPGAPAPAPAPAPPEGVDPSQMTYDGASPGELSPAAIAQRARGHEPRDASGTAWRPDSSPVHALTVPARAWTFLIDFSALGGADAQETPRGGHQSSAPTGPCWRWAAASRGEISSPG